MTMQIFEQLEDFHNSIHQFQKKLNEIKSIKRSEEGEILKELNSIISPAGGAYGQYTYLFEAAGQKARDINNDFWDRMESKGEYQDDD